MTTTPRLVPLSIVRDAGLRLALAVNESDSGPLVLALDASSTTVLGAIVDVECDPVEWIEIRVQEPLRMVRTAVAAQIGADNAWIDRRWRDEVRLSRDVVEGLIRTGWEERGPTLRIDVAARTAESLVDRCGRHGELCDDDSVLKAAGLPAYSSSDRRYLVFRDDAVEAVEFVEVDERAGLAEAEDRSSPLARTGSSFVWNAARGGVICRRLRPIDLPTYIEVLEGRRWGGVGDAEASRSIHAALVDASADRATPDNLGGFLHAMTGDPSTRVAELLHLKLSLLLDAVETVRAATRATRRPLLNLDAGSFRVAVGSVGRAMPLHWTARAELVRPGAAAQIPLRGVPEGWIVPLLWGDESPYRSGAVAGHPSVRGEIFLERVNFVPDGAAGGVVSMRGTLELRDRVILEPSDLIVARFPRRSKVMEAYLRPARDQSRAGTVVFDSIPQVVDSDDAEELRTAQGLVIDRVTCDIVPAYGSTSDLHALGVLGVRLLLGGAQRHLPTAIRLVKQAAKMLAAAEGESGSERASLAGIVAADSGLHEGLAPCWLTESESAADIGFAGIPCETWWEILETVVLPCFSDAGPRWFAATADEASARADTRILDALAAAVRREVRKTRSLVVVDWTAATEIGLVVARSRG